MSAPHGQWVGILHRDKYSDNWVTLYVLINKRNLSSICQ